MKILIPLAIAAICTIVPPGCGSTTSPEERECLEGNSRYSGGSRFIWNKGLRECRTLSIDE